MPTFAEETTPPPAPYNVTVNASQTRVHVFWSSVVEGDVQTVDVPEFDYLGEDWDELQIESSQTVSYGPIAELEWPDYIYDGEITGFQVQLALDVNFANIVRHDRSVLGHTKTWRYKKPSSRTFYARVRSYDALGNYSEWVSNSHYNKFPYQPCRPNVRFKKQDNGNYQATVSYQNDQTLSPDLDEDISRFQFAAREVEWTRSSEPLNATEGIITVTHYDADEVPAAFPFTIYVNDEQMSVDSITGGGSLNWHVTRGINSTTAATHNDGVKIFYFGQGTQSTIQTIVLDDESGGTSSRVSYRGLDPDSRWKFRVRAIDAQNRKSYWSPYTPSLKAAVGTEYDNGDCVGGTGIAGDPSSDVVPPDATDDGTTDDGEDVPTVETSNWPHERIIRFEVDSSTGFESTPAVTGFDAIATSARVYVESAPTTGAATVDININAGSFLTLTIPQDSTYSDLTWVTPFTLRIGSQEGQTLMNTDAITVMQTDMQDATGTVTVYLMVYLQ